MYQENIQWQHSVQWQKRAWWKFGYKWNLQYYVYVIFMPLENSTRLRNETKFRKTLVIVKNSNVLIVINWKCKSGILRNWLLFLLLIGSEKSPHFDSFSLSLMGCKLFYFFFNDKNSSPLWHIAHVVWRECLKHFFQSEGEWQIYLQMDLVQLISGTCP